MRLRTAAREEPFVVVLQWRAMNLSAKRRRPYLAAEADVGSPR